MRAVVASQVIDGYRPGQTLLLYGPDSSGALDTAQADAAGRVPVLRDSDEHGFGEESFGATPFAGAAAGKGFGLERFAEEPFCQTYGRTVLYGRAQEFGVYQHAARVRGKNGELSSIGTAAGVLVNAAPSRPLRSAINVAAGVVSVTITDAA